MRAALLALTAPLWLTACITNVHPDSGLSTRPARKPAERAAPQQGEPAPEAAAQPKTFEALPDGDIGLSFSDDSAWFTARGHLPESGYTEFGLLINDDDAVVLNLGIQRHARVNDDSRLLLGVGLGAYGVFLDEPEDASLGAFALQGVAGYVLPTEVPVRFLTQVAVAPDVTTFGDGESLIDFVAGFDVEVGNFASAFLGYRLLEIENDENVDVTIERGLHLGVRLGF